MGGYLAYSSATSIPDAKKPPVADPNKVDKEAADITLANKKKKGYPSTMVARMLGPGANDTFGNQATLGV